MTGTMTSAGLDVHARSIDAAAICVATGELTRRLVNEANAIGTTYRRAQTLAGPIRGRSMKLSVTYTRAAIRLSNQVPGSAEPRDTRAHEERIERRLWSLAGEAFDMAPTASAPRLYVETLNEMIDGETVCVRVAARSNRVPTAVLVLEVLGSSLALGLLAAYLAIVGRGPDARPRRTKQPGMCGDKKRSVRGDSLTIRSPSWSSQNARLPS